MAITEELSERGWAWPLGIGLVVAAVSAGPQIVKSGRPLVKRAIKGYLAIQERSREMFAETSERMQDLYAEAKHEYEQEAQSMQAEAQEEQQPEKPAEGAKPSRAKKKSETSAKASAEEK